MQEMSTMMQWVSFVLAPILWDKMVAARICDSVMMPSNADIPCHITPSLDNPVDSNATVETCFNCKCLGSN